MKIASLFLTIFIIQVAPFALSGPANTSVPIVNYRSPEDSHPDLAKMRVYRNYYQVERLSPPAIQVQVWYRCPEEPGSEQKVWHVVEMAVKEGEVHSDLGLERELPNWTAFAGYPIPPNNLMPVPDAFKKQEDEVKLAIMNNHRDSQIDAVTVGFEGLGTRLAVTEMIPYSRFNPASPTLGAKGAHLYIASPNYNQLMDLGMRGSGVGSLAVESARGRAPVDYIASPNWLEYKLPAAIEGSSLYFLDYMRFEDKPRPDYLAARADLELAILKLALDLNLQPALSHPIENVLAAQEATLLPRGLRQYLEYDVNISARASDYKKQKDERVRFVIPTDLLMVSLTKTASVSGLTLHLEGTVSASPNLTLTVMDASGKAIQNRILLSSSPAYLPATEMLVDGDVRALGGDLNLETQGPKISFPGRGEFTSFDVYPDSRISPTRLTGEAQFQ